MTLAAVATSVLLRPAFGTIAGRDRLGHGRCEEHLSAALVDQCPARIDSEGRPRSQDAEEDN